MSNSVSPTSSLEELNIISDNIVEGVNILGVDGGYSYKLPTATTDTLGGVIIGNGIGVTDDGIISANIDNSLNFKNGKISRFGKSWISLDSSVINLTNKCANFSGSQIFSVRLSPDGNFLHISMSMWVSSLTANSFFNICMLNFDSSVLKHEYVIAGGGAWKEVNVKRYGTAVKNKTYFNHGGSPWIGGYAFANDSDSRSFYFDSVLPVQYLGDYPIA